MEIFHKYDLKISKHERNFDKLNSTLKLRTSIHKQTNKQKTRNTTEKDKRQMTKQKIGAAYIKR